MRKKHTLDELFTIGLNGEPADEFVRVSRDDIAGTARHRKPPLVLRRHLVTQVEPPAAYIEEHRVNARAIMRRHIGSDGDAAKTAARDALKARMEVTSSAEMDRRVYAFIEETFGLDV